MNAGSAINPARDFSPRLLSYLAGWNDAFTVNYFCLFFIMVTFLKINAKTERLEKCSGWQQLVLGALDLASHWRTGNFDVSVY